MSSLCRSLYGKDHLGNDVGRPGGEWKKMLMGTGLGRGQGALLVSPVNQTFIQEVGEVRESLVDD